MQRVADNFGSGHGKMSGMSWAMLFALAAPLIAGELNFRAHTIEADLQSGYQTIAVDIDRDGRPDVVGLSQRSETLYWYENPSWKRRALVSGMQGMITLAAADLDSDGVPEIALGTHFGQTDETSEGRVYIVEHRGDPVRLWQAREIDRLPTTHRLRFVDLDGDGAAELVNSPLTGPGCRKPLFDCDTPLVFYEQGDWKRQYISEDLDGVVHGMREADWDGNVLMTASMGGVVTFRWSGGNWERRHLAAGDPRERPLNGASEIRLGRLDGEPFLSTIEPWHGNQVVVYRRRDGGGRRREVLTDSLRDGHVLNVADFDGDGNDELVAGARGEPFSLALYRFADGRWERYALDEGGLSAAGCDIADLDSDKDLDMVCIGARTDNIKWYENLTD